VRLVHLAHHTLHLPPVEAAPRKVLAKERDIGGINKQIVWPVARLPARRHPGTQGSHDYPAHTHVLACVRACRHAHALVGSCPLSNAVLLLPANKANMLQAQRYGTKARVLHSNASSHQSAHHSMYFSKSFLPERSCRLAQVATPCAKFSLQQANAASGQRTWAPGTNPLCLLQWSAGKGRGAHALQAESEDERAPRSKGQVCPPYTGFLPPVSLSSTNLSGKELHFHFLASTSDFSYP